MGIDEKKEQVWKEKEFRSGNSSNDIPLIHVLGAVPIIVVAVSGGFYTGIQANQGGTTHSALSNVSEGKVHMFIDGYQITFLPEDHPEIQGRHGFTYDYIDNDIYIQKGLSMSRTLTVCNHELIHNLGIGEEHHDFINRNHDVVSSEVCSKLRQRLQAIDGLPR